MATTSRWGQWGTLLAGLPYDVQAALYNRLADRTDLRAAQCYRLPLLYSTTRLTVAAAGTAQANWRFLSLTAVYGLSKTFDNETVQAAGVTAGMSGLTAVYPSEVDLQINFNQGATTWIGSQAEPAQLGILGSAEAATRVDPICATRDDIWDLTLTGTAGLANNVFATVCLHGVKIYNAGGAI